MKKFILLLLPLFIFSYYEISLRKAGDVLELVENAYIDYYLNPAILTELKERFINFGVYGDYKKAQFANLSFLNPNKSFPYALIFTNFEAEFFSEKSFAFLCAKKRKDYSYGFKFQIGEIRNFYEELLNYERSEYNLEREGPLGETAANYFYFEDYYFLEKRVLKTFNYYKNKNTLFFLPLAFYLKFKDWDIGVDFENSIEKRINKSEKEKKRLDIEEEYKYEKKGDTSLTVFEEYLSKDIEYDNYWRESNDTFKIWNKNISLFLRKKIKGIRDKKILFNRIGYSFENTKGNTYEKSFDSTYESFLEWEKSYENGKWDCDSFLNEESKGIRNERKEMIKGRKENLYQEGGFGFTYYFSLLKLDNTIFLGIKEKIDLLKEKEWSGKGKIGFYLGNNLEKGSFSFFPIFIPYWVFEEDKIEDKIKISYSYQIFFDLKFKIFNLLTWRFSYLLPGEKEAYKRWVLSLYINY